MTIFPDIGEFSDLHSTIEDWIKNGEWSHCSEEQVSIQEDLEDLAASHTIDSLEPLDLPKPVGPNIFLERILETSNFTAKKYYCIWTLFAGITPHFAGSDDLDPIVTSCPMLEKARIINDFLQKILGVTDAEIKLSLFSDKKITLLVPCDLDTALYLSYRQHRKRSTSQLSTTQKQRWWRRLHDAIPQFSHSGKKRFSYVEHSFKLDPSIHENAYLKSLYEINASLVLKRISTFFYQMAESVKKHPGSNLQLIHKKVLAKQIASWDAEFERLQQLGLFLIDIES